MNDDHHDDSLPDRAKGPFNSDDTDTADASAPAATHGDEHGELAGAPHGAEQGHFVNDPPLEERPSLHPTSRDAGISDAARAVRADDPLEHAGARQEGFTETGAASGKVAMPDGEEPVAGDEDHEDRGRGIS